MDRSDTLDTRTGSLRQSCRHRRGCPSTFARRFRRATGLAPKDYVHAVRIEEAKQVLETTDDTVEEIAHQAGYEDTPSFRRVFKRATGLTPGEYRRTLGKDRFKRYSDPSVPIHSTKGKLARSAYS
ncbi:MAG TPA: helix-turn-helix transcriptional regulator [Alphaproteobacteria bacterium]|nr:helix-turn-helix transcriptional regulator [Alphaproteobacteria bacterium]